MKELRRITKLRDLAQTVLRADADRVSETEYGNHDWRLRRGRKQLAIVDAKLVAVAPFLFLYCRVMHVSREKADSFLRAR